MYCVCKCVCVCVCVCVGGGGGGGGLDKSVRARRVNRKDPTSFCIYNINGIQKFEKLEKWAEFRKRNKTELIEGNICLVLSVSNRGIFHKFF